MNNKYIQTKCGSKKKQILPKLWLTTNVLYIVSSCLDDKIKWKINIYYTFLLYPFIQRENIMSFAPCLLSWKMLSVVRLMISVLKKDI